MKPLPPVVFLIVLAAIVVTSIAANVHVWLGRFESGAAIELARLEVAELPRVEAENRRLRERQMPAAQLAALRADHEALPRLRAELEQLQKSGH